MLNRSGFCLVLCFVGVVAAPAPVSAESVDALLRKGIQLRKEGNDQEAFKVFEQAVAVQKTPRTVGQLGLSEQALGLWVRAEAHLVEALAGKDDDTWVQKYRPALEKSLQTIRAHLGSVEIWGSPGGAEVLLNGKSVGKLPATGPVRVEVGHVAYTVRADGYVEATGTMDVKSGDSLRENVALIEAPQPRPPVSAVPALTAPPPGSEEGNPSLVRQGPPADEATDSPVYTRWWFWTAIGAVVAGGVRHRPRADARQQLDVRSERRVQQLGVLR